MSQLDDLIDELAPNGVVHRDLGSIIKLHFGARVTKMADAGTKYPVYGGGGESFRIDDFNREDQYVISRFAMSAKCVRKVAGKFWMLDSGFTFEPTDESVDKDYVAYVLLNMQPEIYACSSQGAQKNLKTKEFKRFRVAVPPLEVQREIVRILDNFTELETELEAELEARRRQYEHYRRALLSSGAVGRWEHIRDIADFYNAKAHERLVHPDGTVALMTARFISRGVANRFVHPEDVLTPAFAGDVALVMSDLPNGRALARTFYVDEDSKYAANQRVCLLRSRDPSMLLPRYLAYALNRHEQLLAYDTGVDQTHLKKDYILDVKLPLPTIEDQLRIVQTLDKFDAIVNNLSIGLPAELAARRKQYEYYRDKLLTFEESV